MELEFDREVTHCYEVAASGTVCQEETLETIVPDACPDILRIVAVCAQATLNGKQARDGLAEASGSVRAVVLYQPEEGGGLRRLEAALPFTSQMDAPTLTQQGMVSACARVRGAEAGPSIPERFCCGWTWRWRSPPSSLRSTCAARLCWSRRSTRWSR